MKQNKIAILINDFCQKHLDEEYMNLCSLLVEDLIKYDEDMFKRGKEEIWAAAVVWTIGSVNFLSDKSSEPYATLADVCDYFGTSTSTIGQKASKIRDLFEIDYFNERYQRAGSGIADIFGKLLMTEEGYIMPAGWLEDDEDEEEYIEDEEGEELPGYYTIIMSATRSYKRAEIFQLEFAFKSLLDEDEKFQSTKLLDDRKFHFNFYGRPAKIWKFENNVLPNKYIILDVIDQPVH